MCDVMSLSLLPLLPVGGSDIAGISIHSVMSVFDEGI